MLLQILFTAFLDFKVETDWRKAPKGLGDSLPIGKVVEAQTLVW